MQSIQDSLVRKALCYIQDNVHRSIRVNDLLDYLSVSRRTLERRFKEKLGHSPHFAINRARVEVAKKLLEATDMNMEDIAEHCGFSEARILYRNFRQVAGVTPAKIPEKLPLTETGAHRGAINPQRVKKRYIPLVDRLLKWREQPSGNHVSYPTPNQHAGPNADGSLTGIDKAASGRDLVFKKDSEYFYAAFSLPIQDYHSLFMGGHDWDRRTVSGKLPEVTGINWLDNEESLPFTQDTSNGSLAFKSTANPY